MEHISESDLLKTAALDSGLDLEYRQARKNRLDGDLEAFLERYGFDLFRICRNLEKSRWDKVKRCRKRIGSSVLSGNAYFVTLTFKPEVLETTSAKTRRRYVSRQLKACSTCYVGNIDFGGKTCREHYHALLQAGERPTFEWWTKNCGFVKVEKVGDTERDLKKVAKYTAKLSSHAMKESTSLGGLPKCPRLIYSRRTL